MFTYKSYMSNVISLCSGISFRFVMSCASCIEFVTLNSFLGGIISLIFYA
jgi:hypothetical protein